MRAADAFLLLLATISIAHAQSPIQKCVDASGKTHYQDSPCAVEQTAAGTIKRDTAQPDQAAFIRAEQDRMRLKLMEIDRERLWLADQIRQAKQEQAEAAARARQAAEDRADARNKALIDALQQPYGGPYITGPSIGHERVRERVIERQVPAPAPAPRPVTYTGPAASAPKK